VKRSALIGWSSAVWDVDVDVGEIFLRQFGENGELQALPALGCSELRAPSPLDTLRRRLIERRGFSLIQLLHAGIEIFMVATAQLGCAYCQSLPFFALPLKRAGLRPS
jgi:hypothetical protein